MICLLMAGAGMVAADEFARASVRFEQNATDKDAEVVFDATGGDKGIAGLSVVAPDGRTIIDFAAPNSKLGIRHLNFESPEPQNDGRVQADFPEGVYTFTGTTVTGTRLRSEARLSHKLPPTASLIHPAPDAEGVPTTGLKIAWGHVDNVEFYVVSIEQEDSGVEMAVTLPATVTEFCVPEHFLATATEYTLAIGTVSEDGNSTFVETSFTTAGKK
jgi:hypothetical protein